MTVAKLPCSVDVLPLRTEPYRSQSDEFTPIDSINERSEAKEDHRLQLALQDSFVQCISGLILTDEWC